MWAFFNVFLMLKLLTIKPKGYIIISVEKQRQNKERLIEMEEWKEIKNFENYWVSSEGKIWSEKSNKFLKAQANKKGYLWVYLWQNGKYYWRSIHRLVAEAFIENPENKPTVDHINRNRLDNRVKNLRWADRYEQIKNRDLTEYKNKQQKARGTTIIEKINGEVSIGYPALRAVPDINYSALSNHVCKGEVEFTCKGRTFICPSNMVK